MYHDQCYLVNFAAGNYFGALLTSTYIVLSKHHKNNSKTYLTNLKINK